LKGRSRKTAIRGKKETKRNNKKVLFRSRWETKLELIKGRVRTTRRATTAALEKVRTMPRMTMLLKNRLALKPWARR